MMKSTKYILKNAGLLLVHPFLRQLFNYLDYLDDKNQFKSEETVWRAVYLLHYLATGQDGAANEADLGMSKLLTGMTVGDTIPLDLVLTKNEIDYANEVLQVIISRWDKLGNTSNDGIRNTFLIRNGMLKEKDEAFNLVIETSGTDILLDYLPWSINVVKLPCMKETIYTSWR